MVHFGNLCAKHSKNGVIPFHPGGVFQNQSIPASVAKHAMGISHFTPVVFCKKNGRVPNRFVWIGLVMFFNSMNLDAIYGFSSMPEVNKSQFCRRATNRRGSLPLWYINQVSSLSSSSEVVSERVRPALVSHDDIGGNLLWHSGSR